MALSADAKIANVEGSIREYVSTNLSSTFPSAIDYGGGQAFSDASLSEWLRVRLLAPARSPEMTGPFGHDGKRAREMFHLLALNIFIRPAKLATLNTLRLPTLRDTVAQYFEEGTTILVKDYGADSGTIGNLFSVGFDLDQSIIDPGREAEILNWALIVALRWAETWTAA